MHPEVWKSKIASLKINLFPFHLLAAPFGGKAPDLGVHREAPWSHSGHHQWPDSAGWLGDLRRGFAVGSQGAGDRRARLRSDGTIWL